MIISHIKKFIYKIYLYYLYFIKYIYTYNYLLKTRTHPSIILGVSCLILCIPGIYGIYMGQILQGIFACIMTLFSFLSDYIGGYISHFISRYSFLLLDQFGILMYTISLIILYINNKSYILLFINLLLAFFIINIVLYNYTKNSKNRKEWNIRHSIWHIIIFLYLIFVHHNGITDNTNFSLNNIYDYISIISIISVFIICIYIYNL